MEDKVIKNIKLYFSFLVASLKRMMEYRVDCLVRNNITTRISNYRINIYMDYISNYR